MLAFFLGLLPSPSATRVVQLRCEYLTNPLGIDTPDPRLSWIIESNERGVSQSAYQVLAASSEVALRKGPADLWDTGKVRSDS